MISSWNGYTFTNFPTSKPDGGFMLMNLAEGNYRRQLYTAYNNPNLYSRYNYYSGTTVTWSPWRTLAFTDSTVANANSLGGKAAAQYVTTDTTQTISGVKTFTSKVVLKSICTASMGWADSNAPRLEFHNANSTQNIAFVLTDYDVYRAPAGLKLVGNQGNEWLEAPRFVKTGGTASQFLKADGSVDSRALWCLTHSKSPQQWHRSI